MSETVESTLESALRSHEQGDFDTAERYYQEALIADPHDIEAVHCAGVLALQAGNFSLAVARLTWALQLGATLPGTYLMLGRAFKGQGDLDAAIECYRSAIAGDPGMVDARISLGLALKDQGRVEEAVAAYRAALARNPDSFEALLNLGNALQLRGESGEAIASYNRAAAVRSDSAALHYNLGKALRVQLRDSEAVERFQRAVLIDPGYLDAYFNLGNTLSSVGRYDESIQCFRYLLGLIEAGAGHPAAPDERDLLHRNTRTALIAPLVWTWRSEEAAVLLGEALVREPDSVVLNEYRLVTLPYRCESQVDLLEVYRHYQRISPLSALLPLVSAPRQFAPDRLRIGYLSGDLRDHSIAFFLESLLEHHDRSAFEIHCYSVNRSDDEVTARLKSRSDAWVDAGDLEDEALARRIVEDGIDILVDLAGRTVPNRIAVMASRPAFVQISYLGYPTYSGLPQIGWRITDPVIDPPGEAGLESERPLRLSHSMFCYRPPVDAPERGERRAGEGGICFGSFNQVQKLSPPVLSLWSRILKETPGSRLMLKAAGFGEEATRQRVMSAFADAGIDPDRVDIRPGIDDRLDHLALYGEIDIALDPFPYNGATTSCEALWMGAPVVTLAGSTHASRMGASILHAIGLTDLVAHSADEYVDIAVRLAHSRERLENLQSTLRVRFSDSPLREEESHARDFECALREAWSASVS